MRLQVTVRRGHVNDDVRRYVESKLAKLGRRLHPDTLVEVDLDREQNPKIADGHVVEAELHMKGPNLFGREAASTYEAAIDLLVVLPLYYSGRSVLGRKRRVSDSQFSILDFQFQFLAGE